MSSAANRYSGQVWMVRWDSAMTTTPLMPKGLNSWKTTSTIVAWARFAASIRAPFTASRSLITSGSQSNNSTRRCRPRAFNPVALLSPIQSSTAPLLRRLPASPLDEKISRLHQNLFHCMARFFRLQEKNALSSALRSPDEALRGGPETDTFRLHPDAGSVE